MYRVWYWATIDRENDGRFVASIPNLWDLAPMATPTRTRLLTSPSWRANVCGLPRRPPPLITKSF
jgi:hypothetical protein